MMEIAKILVPTDLSSCSRQAALYASELAQGFGAELHLLHVWEYPEYVGGDVSVVQTGRIAHGAAEAKSLWALAEGEAATALGHFVESLEEHGVRLVGRHLRAGSAAIVIGEFAVSEGFDLVVAGTHGRSGTAHFMLGSVTERVVRTCAVPVLTIRCPDAG